MNLFFFLPSPSSSSSFLGTSSFALLLILCFFFDFLLGDYLSERRETRVAPSFFFSLLFFLLSLLCVRSPYTTAPLKRRFKVYVVHTDMAVFASSFFSLFVSFSFSLSICIWKANEKGRRKKVDAKEVKMGYRPRNRERAISTGKKKRKGTERKEKKKVGLVSAGTLSSVTIFFFKAGV